MLPFSVEHVVHDVDSTLHHLATDVPKDAKRAITALQRDAKKTVTEIDREVKSATDDMEHGAHALDCIGSSETVVGTIAGGAKVVGGSSHVTIFSDGLSGDDGKLMTRLWDTYGIKPIIGMRKLWKDPEETRLLPGETNAVYSQSSHRSIVVVTSGNESTKNGQPSSA